MKEKNPTNSSLSLVFLLKTPADSSINWLLCNNLARNNQNLALITDRPLVSYTDFTYRKLYFRLEHKPRKCPVVQQ